MRDRRSGFTLLELMVTIAVISILAAIALPSFFSESRKTKAFSEVQPMFNDLRVRFEQYLQENGSYPATIGEATLHPAGTPIATTRPINPLPAAWQAIKVRITGNDRVYCGYTWATGLANDNINVGPIATATFTFAPPSTDWYYLLAKCDMDGDGAVFSYYFASSSNPTILKDNEGK
ncbi:MAG TPA: type II secretion system protein [Kofleriaceae bacterium]|jgi:prepilin-type N-terminal cleavage/methylation domain-containing protein|nr:type II secretion system protein [Kofleriaceae bacterium]